MKCNVLLPSHPRYNYKAIKIILFTRFLRLLQLFSTEIRLSLEEKVKKEKRFRLVLFSEQTFEEVRSFHYRSWYLWAAVLGVICLTAGAIFALLSIDPLRNILFESGKYVPPEELILLREKVNDLEDQSQAQNLYITKLRQLLSGEVIVDTSTTHLDVAADSIYTVDRIEEDDKLREAFDLEEQLSNAAINRDKIVSKERDFRSLEQLYLIPPVTGSVSMGFDLQKEHHGIDINAAKNTPVKSALSGYIIYAGWSLETGNTVGIQHDHNIITFYKHNSALLKKAGSFVQAGEAVAIIGNTGTLSSGPHLHFELWVDGKPVDPIKFINF